MFDVSSLWVPHGGEDELATIRSFFCVTKLSHTREQKASVLRH